MAVFDSAFSSFLAGVSYIDAGIGLGTFPTPWFAWALSAGILMDFTIKEVGRTMYPVTAGLRFHRVWLE